MSYKKALQCPLKWIGMCAFTDNSIYLMHFICSVYSEGVEFLVVLVEWIQGKILFQIVEVLNGEGKLTVCRNRVGKCNKF